MSVDESSEESAGATQHYPGHFVPASVRHTPTDDRLAPHRDLDNRGVPQINAYAPSDTNRVIFHELDPDNDPSGTAFIKATHQCVINAEDCR